jgi:hypothetical protein
MYCPRGYSRSCFREVRKRVNSAKGMIIQGGGGGGENGYLPPKMPIRRVTFVYMCIGVQLFIYTALRSGAKRLHSNVEYISLFRRPSRLSGERHYYLVQMQVSSHVFIADQLMVYSASHSCFHQNPSSGIEEGIVMNYASVHECHVMLVILELG